MFARINLTGTQVTKDGYLKVRVDLYPNPADKTYTQQYVDIQDRSPTAEELANPALFALIPTHKQLNPCLCHFIKINSGTTLTQLRNLIKSLFNATDVPKIDTALSTDDMPTLRQLMSTKLGTASTLLGGTDKVALVSTVNTRFASLGDVKL